MSPFNLPANGLPGDLYRPLTTFSFALNYWISGLSPDPFHLFNRLLHVLTCLGIFWALRRLFANPQVALFTTLLFAVHPVQTEAITYLNGRSDSLAMLCFVFAWLFFVRARQEAAFPRRSYGLSLLFYFLALLSKESAITWLGVVLLTEWVFFAQGSLKRLGEDWRTKLLHVYAAYLAVTAAYLLLRSTALRGIFSIPPGFAENPLAHVSSTARILTASKVLFQSLGQLLWPAHFSPDYSYNQIPLITHWSSPAAWVWVILSALLLAGLILSYRRAPDVFFGLGFFLVTYSVVSNLIFPIGTIRADRLSYMPSLGIFLVVGILLANLDESNVGESSRRLVPSAFALILLLLFTRTVLRNRDWSDPFALYQRAAVVAPRSVRVRDSLGMEYYARNDRVRALEEFRIAESIYPEYPNVLSNLGAILMQEGKLDESLAYFHRALALAPYKTETRNNLGVLLRRRGDFSGALAQYDLVIQQDPSNVEAHLNKATLFENQGKINDAIRECNMAIELNPGSALARGKLMDLVQKANSAPVLQNVENIKAGTPLRVGQ